MHFTSGMSATASRIEMAVRFLGKTIVRKGREGRKEEKNVEKS